MSLPYKNIFGRRDGRGRRPWLLIPKIVGVTMFFGALLAAGLVWFASLLFQGRSSQVLDITQAVVVMSLLIRFLMLPGLLLALLCGLLLFMQHPSAFLRMRWFQVKIISVLLGIPTAHLWMSTRLALIRQALALSADHTRIDHQISWGFFAVYLWILWLIVLGRVKPRLGQNWAAAYPRPTTPAAESHP